MGEGAKRTRTVIRECNIPATAWGGSWAVAVRKRVAPALRPRGPHGTNARRHPLRRRPFRGALLPGRWAAGDDLSRRGVAGRIEFSPAPVPAAPARRHRAAPCVVATERGRFGECVHRCAPDRRRADSPPRGRRLARPRRDESHSRAAPERRAVEYLHSCRGACGAGCCGVGAQACAAVDPRRGTRRRGVRARRGLACRCSDQDSVAGRRGGDSNPR